MGHRPRVVVESPSLETFKRCLEMALSKQLKVSLLEQGC